MISPSLADAIINGRRKPRPPRPGPPYVFPPTLPPREGPAPLPPGIGVIPPRGGILGPPTGQPPWIQPYPPGTIQNMTLAALLAHRGLL